MKYLKWLGVMLLFAVIACATSSQKSKKAPAELKYAITLGESGGFTGNNSGYVISQTGEVGKFSGMIEPAKNALLKGHLNQEQILRLNNLISKLINVNYSEKGNLTSYITLSRGEEKIRFAWPGTAPEKNVPEPVRKFYYELTSIINSL